MAASGAVKTRRATAHRVGVRTLSAAFTRRKADLESDGPFLSSCPDRIAVFVCVGALTILDALEEEVDAPTLAWWLAERQLPSGGLNGRPEKLEDVSS